MSATLIAQGEVWWADLGEPAGSSAGYVRPVIVVQGDSVNNSRIGTILCIPTTRTLKWGSLPTCLTLPAKATGLNYEAVAQATLMLAVARTSMIESVGRISQQHLARLFKCLDIALGR